MINIICVRVGTLYGPEYVERLYNMVSRNLSGNFKFYCITDDSTPIENVELIHIKNQKYKKQWWHKVHLFDSTLGLEGRMLYFDLDVVIVNKLNRLIDSLGDDFYGIRDFNRKFNPRWNKLNSSVMSWMAGHHNHIFDKFKRESKSAQRLHGDQDWIWQTAQHQIKFWPEPWIQSYKWEIRNRSELLYRGNKRFFKETRDDVKIHKQCSVLVFHGEPKPHEVKDKIIVDNWK